MAVHHVAAYAENLFFAYVEVYTEGLRVGYALRASEAAEAARSSVSEAGFVDIVGGTEECYLIAVPEAVHGERASVSVVGAVSGLHVSEPAVFHIFLYGEVYHGFVFAVVHPCHAGQIAFAVYYL